MWSERDIRYEVPRLLEGIRPEVLGQERALLRREPPDTLGQLA
jgi:hypothetical protein